MYNFFSVSGEGVGVGCFLIWCLLLINYRFGPCQEKIFYFQHWKKETKGRESRGSRDSRDSRGGNAPREAGARLCPSRSLGWGCFLIWFLLLINYRFGPCQEKNFYFQHWKNRNERQGGQGGQRQQRQQRQQGRQCPSRSWGKAMPLEKLGQAHPLSLTLENFIHWG